MRPRMNIFVVQYDVTIAVVLLLGIVSGKLYQKVAMHPTPHNCNQHVPCLVTLFVDTPNHIQKCEFFIPIHSILQNALLPNDPIVNR